MVERQLPKLNVAGSSPVSRSKIRNPREAQKSTKSLIHKASRGFFFVCILLFYRCFDKKMPVKNSVKHSPAPHLDQVTIFYSFKFSDGFSVSICFSSSFAFAFRTSMALISGFGIGTPINPRFSTITFSFRQTKTAPESAVIFNRYCQSMDKPFLICSAACSLCLR